MRISRVLSPPGRRGIISLGSASLRTSSSRPGTQMERAAPRPCLTLLRVGFAMRPPLPSARCALTAPFHPCLCPPRRLDHRRSTLCGTFHRLTPPGSYPALCPAELGLSSHWCLSAQGRFQLARSTRSFPAPRLLEQAWKFKRSGRSGKGLSRLFPQDPFPALARRPGLNTGANIHRNHGDGSGYGSP